MNYSLLAKDSLDIILPPWTLKTSKSQSWTHWIRPILKASVPPPPDPFEILGPLGLNPHVGVPKYTLCLAAWFFHLYLAS